MRDSSYVIWGGRFQIIHKGHEFVLKYAEKHYKNICIGIVCPNPSSPPCSADKHDKFREEYNPFSYFQRVYLWDLLLKYHNIDAVIVPHWHPRFSLCLEKTFLPPRGDREWIIPLIGDEIVKIDDYEKKRNEKVFHKFEVPNELQSINASQIRQRFNDKDPNYKHDIPPALLAKTEEFLDLNNHILNDNYIILPLIGDNIDPTLLCSGMYEAINTHSKLIIAPIVDVQNKDDWWNYEPIMNDYLLTFYRRYEIINKMMKSIPYYDFYIIPIIARENTYEHLDAFMPKIKNRVWLLYKQLNKASAFKTINNNMDERISKFDTNNIPTDIIAKLSNIKQIMLEKLDYYTRIKNQNREEDHMDTDTKIQINGDIKAQQVNIAQTISAPFIGSVSSSAQELEQLIKLIICSNNEKEIQESVKNVDDIIKDTSENEIPIESLVKKHITSSEEKESFLQKICRFTHDIPKSLIIALLCEAAKKMIF